MNIIIILRGDYHQKQPPRILKNRKKMKQKGGCKNGQICMRRMWICL